MNNPKKQLRFNLGNPEEGILNFDVCIEAETVDDAVGKLFDYMLDFKRRHSVPPSPLGKNATPKEIGDQALHRLRLATEPTTFVLTLHLFCEYWLNRLLAHTFPHRDLTRYDFFKKLEITFGVGKLPQSLFANLCKLNDLRKGIAHDIDYDLTQMDLNYQGCDEGFRLSNYKPSYSPDAKQHHISNVLNGVLFMTLVPLQNHCIKELKLGGEHSGQRTFR